MAEAKMHQQLTKKETHYYSYTSNIFLEKRKNDPLVTLASCPRGKVRGKDITTLNF